MGDNPGPQAHIFECLENGLQRDNCGSDMGGQTVIKLLGGEEESDVVVTVLEVMCA